MSFVGFYFLGSGPVPVLFIIIKQNAEKKQEYGLRFEVDCLGAELRPGRRADRKCRAARKHRVLRTIILTQKLDLRDTFCSHPQFNSIYTGEIYLAKTRCFGGVACDGFQAAAGAALLTINR